MKKLAFGLVLLHLGVSLLLAQQGRSIRDPVIDTESAEGQLITQAGMAEDPAEKIKYLEAFVRKYNEHPSIGYVYLQLQNLYAGEEPEKVIEYGKKLLEIAPNDIEIRHNLTKAYEATQNWEALLPHLIETKPLAEEEANAPEPKDAYEEDVAAWKSDVEYTKGVVQYIEYSLYTSSFQINDPQLKLKYAEALREHYPNGEYGKKAWTQFVSAYQQLGEYEKMLEAMAKAVEISPDESYLFTLAENHFRRQQHDQAKAYAEQLVQLMEQRSKPDHMSEEEWQKHKELFTAYGNFVLGKILVAQAGNNLQMYRDGRRLLLSAVEPIKEKGGENYGALAYFLGVCYVKLDIQGDNVRAATNWMSVASNTKSPYQAEARKALQAIQGMVR